jgi:hypothetical protein
MRAAATAASVAAAERRSAEAAAAAERRSAASAAEVERIRSAFAAQRSPVSRSASASGFFPPPTRAKSASTSALQEPPQIMRTMSAPVSRSASPTSLRDASPIPMSPRNASPRNASPLSTSPIRMLSPIPPMSPPASVQILQPQNLTSSRISDEDLQKTKLFVSEMQNKMRQREQQQQQQQQKPNSSMASLMRPLAPMPPLAQGAAVEWQLSQQQKQQEQLNSSIASLMMPPLAQVAVERQLSQQQHPQQPPSAAAAAAAAESPLRRFSSDSGVSSSGSSLHTAPSSDSGFSSSGLSFQTAPGEEELAVLEDYLLESPEHIQALINRYYRGPELSLISSKEIQAAAEQIESEQQRDLEDEIVKLLDTVVVPSANLPATTRASRVKQIADYITDVVRRSQSMGGNKSNKSKKKHTIINKKKHTMNKKKHSTRRKRGGKGGKSRRCRKPCPKNLSRKKYY